MAVRFKKAGERRRTFLAQWRRHRNLSQEALADRISTIAGQSISTGQLSRYETGETPYNQDFLEAAADALNCEPADLLMRDPTDPDGIWSVWDTLAQPQRPTAIAILKTLKGTGTGG